MSDSYFMDAICINCKDKTQQVEIPFSEPVDNNNIINQKQCSNCGLYSLKVQQDNANLE